MIMYYKKSQWEGKCKEDTIWDDHQKIDAITKIEK